MKRLLLVLLLIFAVCLTCGCTKEAEAIAHTTDNTKMSNAPADKQEIASEIISLDTFFVKYNLSLSDFNIIKRQTNEDQKTDFVWVSITGSNDSFDYVSEYKLTYNKYNDGWLLDEWEQLSSAYFPKYEPDIEITKQELLERYSDVVFVERKDESNPTSFTNIFSASTERDNVIKEYKVTVHYEYSPDDGWKVKKNDEKYESTTFDIVGEWLFMDDSHEYYISVKELDGRTITCEYAFWNKELPDNDSLWTIRFADSNSYTIHSLQSNGDAYYIRANWVSREASITKMDDDVIWFYSGAFHVNGHTLQRVSSNAAAQNYPAELRKAVGNYTIDFDQIPSSLCDDTMVGYIKCLWLTYQELGLEKQNSVSNLGNKYELQPASFLGRNAQVYLFIEPEEKATPDNLSVNLNGVSFGELKNAIKRIPQLSFYYETDSNIVALIQGVDVQIHMADTFGDLYIRIKRVL